jgi:hypothetical protein
MQHVAATWALNPLLHKALQGITDPLGQGEGVRMILIPSSLWVRMVLIPSLGGCGRPPDQG